MAKAVEFRPTIAPAVDETARKLQAAPVEHAEAVLEAYRTLQTLHDTNALSMLRGLLGAGDTVVSEAVNVLTSPEATRILRNLLVLGALLAAVSPDVLHRMSDSVKPAVERYRGPEDPPSLFRSLFRLFSKDSRRAIATGIAVLEALGHAMEDRTPEEVSGS